MPRQNPPRVVADNLARRIAYERESLGWTYENMARRLTDAGCPINASAAFKIEKGKPRRQVTAAELFAFSAVFDLPLAELAVPPELAAEKVLVAQLRQWAAARDNVAQANADLDKAAEALQLLLTSDLGRDKNVVRAAASYLSKYVAEQWPERYAEDGDGRAEAVEYFLLQLRGVPRDSDEWARHFERWGT